MRITLAQGSGGEETAKLIRDLFAAPLSNPILDRAEDGAVVELSGTVACSTDSFVVTPLVFPGGDIGSLAVYGTANDLAMMGARPQYLTLGVIIEQGMETELLARIAASIGEAAAAAGVAVIAADTKVVEGSGGLYLNTSGIGVIPRGRQVRACGCRPGDRVLVSGPLGNHHACILSARMGIDNQIRSDLAPLFPTVDALFEAGVSIHAMRDVTRGGLGTILNELAAASGCGCALAEELLTVDADTRALCEILGLDPMYMGNEGTFALAVPAADAERALSILRRFRSGAAEIGEITADTRVILRTRYGGSRALPPLRGEGLPRIC